MQALTEDRSRLARELDASYSRYSTLETARLLGRSLSYAIGTAVFSLVVGTVGAPDTQGKTLREIERERYEEPAGAQARSGSGGSAMAE